MSLLILVRHGQSEWNALGKWTGKTDIHLTEQGRLEARATAGLLGEYRLDRVYSSGQIRAKETLSQIQSVLQNHLQPITTPAFNERDYGSYTGLDKWEAKERLGEVEFNRIRRGWDHPIPDGETLRDVYIRTTEYFKTHILKELLDGQNVMLVASGNSLRALAKHLENISDDRVAELEIGIGEAWIYEIDSHGAVTSKTSRGGKIDSSPTTA
jgi:2,3-bisphosphoglycerate-dependent phosphoglycerate mutase